MENREQETGGGEKTKVREGEGKWRRGRMGRGRRGRNITIMDLNMACPQ